MGHPLFWITLSYLVGQAVSILWRAWTVRQSKLNGIESYKAYFLAYWVPITVRVFVATLGIMAWHTYPDLVSGLASKLTSPLGFDIGHNPVPLNTITGAAYGYLADSILDKLAFMFPQLRKEVPPAPGPPATPPAAGNP